nr:hypothetical protein [Cytophagales bacterium]
MIFHRRYTHCTPRYIKDRLKVMYYERLSPSDPWLTSQAVFLLNSLLKPEDIGVEFGSGRSTSWFATRLRHLTSVESDQNWYTSTAKSLANQGLSTKVDYRMSANDDDYANQVNSFAEGSIDFCLVDGKVRDRCALGMVPKIKSGGLMVVDNINWYLPNDLTRSPDSKRSADGPESKTWAAFANKVSSWRKIWTSNGVTDTCIWFKP